VVVITDQVGDAERWLADLQSLVDDIPVALYPPREGFGDVEPHADVAGERVETLEKLGRSGVRLLLTTARAVLEQTSLPRALAGARLELRKGDVRRLEDLTAHLESIGFERVPMVEDVAQFSVRGGIIDIYSFGMAEPVRLEFWGDDLTELRHFDLATQRTTRPTEMALVLPVDVRGDDAYAEKFERSTLTALWPPETLVPPWVIADSRPSGICSTKSFAWARPARPCSSRSTWPRSRRGRRPGGGTTRSGPTPTRSSSNRFIYFLRR
jgi:transcription-repair coupling factor (superfamily II helicase)